jgi:hypothetical protein
MQKQPNIKLRDLLKSKKAKPRKLSELSKTEQNRLAKLKGSGCKVRVIFQ